MCALNRAFNVILNCAPLLSSFEGLYDEMATTPVDEDIIDVLYRCRSEGMNLTGLDNNFFKEQHHQVYGHQSPPPNISQ